VALAPDADADVAGRTVLAIFAHPDDESLACGGTLARLADDGARVVLLCASRGERGQSADPTVIRGPELGRARATELQQAAKVLGISEVILLDHPDGEIRWANVEKLHDQILQAIATHAPVGRQAAIYAVAVAVNYLAFILGVATGLAALGVEYHAARVLAGLCEAAYIYSVMRWIVFAR